jgi:hypothetical protein
LVVELRERDPELFASRRRRQESGRVGEGKPASGVGEDPLANVIPDHYYSRPSPETGGRNEVRSSDVPRAETGLKKL